jgi:signal transduction histidine kinase
MGTGHGPELHDQSGEDLLRQFRFEADHDGLLHWVDASERTPLIGLSLAEAAPLMGFGVDGHVAGAFARRSAFRDGRLLVSGRSRVGGSWCVSGVPLFDEASGRFRGYRGTARRPYPHERQGDQHEAETPDQSSDPSVANAGDDAAQMQRLRELVHELRTPINAISGFGDMIRSQFLGPVPRSYREQADGIVRSAAELTQILEDLSLLVRHPATAVDQPAETGVDAGGTDGADVLRRVLEGHRAQAAARQVELQVEINRSLPPLAVDEQVLERVMSRLLGNLVELCDEGEQIGVDFMSLPRADGSACLSIARPAKLMGVHADELFDPDRAREGAAVDGPRLALGFSLHLLRNVARQFGGDLDIADHDFLLMMPSLTPDHLARRS